MYFNPNLKLKLIKDASERRSIKSIMDILDKSFGFNYTVSNGNVVEVQLISVGLALIPRQLGYLPHLYKIQVPSNKIKKLRNIERCQSAKIINLSDNLLTSPALEGLTTLTDLTSLNLASNQLTTYHELAPLKNLESLNLSDNKIQQIPQCSFSHLKYLDLSGNPIVTLDHIHRYESLIQIKLEKTNLPSKEIEIVDEGIDAIKEYCREKAKNGK